MQLTIDHEKPGHCLDVSWRKDKHHARLVADLETKQFSVYATREGEDGDMRCTAYNLADNSTQWARTSLSEEQIASIGQSDPKGSRKQLKHFSEI